ncbi:Ypar14, super integron cassette [Salinibius halmophilus]|uniref:Ypar14, super integron cassette n=1 Tax=Salinibius halmophilus TaxID=1853216 RepID=UPI000E66006C|nr:Ypar14, super integron cassette [Salinibius halmophilus]
MLVWDETDVLSVLEVIPEVVSDGIWHQYVVEKEGIQLKVIIYQYDGDVRIELTNISSGSSLFSMQLIDCQGVRRTFDKTGEFLEFAPSKYFGSRYDGEQSIPFGVRVRVKPNINVVLYG